MDTKQSDKTTFEAMSFGGLFRIKTLDSILLDAEKPEYQLKRAIGPMQLTLLGIGAIIGAGIFATIGTAAAGDANRPGRRAPLDALVRHHGRRLRLHGALLRGVRLDGADLAARPTPTPTRRWASWWRGSSAGT